MQIHKYAYHEHFPIGVKVKAHVSIFRPEDIDEGVKIEVVDDVVDMTLLIIILE